GSPPTWRSGAGTRRSWGCAPPTPRVWPATSSEPYGSAPGSPAPSGSATTSTRRSSPRASPSPPGSTASPARPGPSRCTTGPPTRGGASGPRPPRSSPISASIPWPSSPPPTPAGWPPASAPSTGPGCAIWRSARARPRSSPPPGSRAATAARPPIGRTSPTPPRSPGRWPSSPAASPLTRPERAAPSSGSPSKSVSLRSSRGPGRRRFPLPPPTPAPSPAPRSTPSPVSLLIGPSASSASAPVIRCPPAPVRPVARPRRLRSAPPLSYPGQISSGRGGAPAQPAGVRSAQAAGRLPASPRPATHPAFPPDLHSFSMSGVGLLAALLDVAAHELLGVLLEHLVDLVQNGVDIVRELLLALLDVRRRGRLGLLDLGLTPPCLLLAAGVLSSHALPPSRGTCLSVHIFPERHDISRRPSSDHTRLTG